MLWSYLSIQPFMCLFAFQLMTMALCLPTRDPQIAIIHNYTLNNEPIHISPLYPSGLYILVQLVKAHAKFVQSYKKWSSMQSAFRVVLNGTKGILPIGKCVLPNSSGQKYKSTQVHSVNLVKNAYDSGKARCDQGAKLVSTKNNTTQKMIPSG